MCLNTINCLNWQDSKQRLFGPSYCHYKLKHLGRLIIYFITYKQDQFQPNNAFLKANDNFVTEMARISSAIAHKETPGATAKYIALNRDPRMYQVYDALTKKWPLCREKILILRIIAYHYVCSSQTFRRFQGSVATWRGVDRPHYTNVDHSKDVKSSHSGRYLSIRYESKMIP